MGAIYLTGKDRMGLYTDLGTMLRAGIPIMEAIESLQEDAKGQLKKALDVMHKALVNGEPLSTALSNMPQSFDPISINLIRAAEEGGALETTLQNLAESTQKDLAFSDELRTSMIYPVFVMVLFGGIVVLMLTFVIPRIAKVFLNLRVHIPAVTTFMIHASQYFQANWRYIAIGLFVAIAGFVVLFKMQKRAIIRGFLALPGLRRLGRNIDLSRFTRSLGLLLHAGVPVDEALTLSRGVVQKAEMVRLVDAMKRQVDAGKPLSGSLRAAKGLVPPIMIRSTETAEKSGTLEITMQDLAAYFEREVSQRLKAITTLLEPILLVVVGLMVGTLMITIIAPIYNLITQIRPS